MNPTREQTERQLERADANGAEAILAELHARLDEAPECERPALDALIARAEVSLDLARRAAVDAHLEDDEEDALEQIEVAYDEGDEQGVEAAQQELHVVEAEQRAAGYYVADRPAGEHRLLVGWLTTGKLVTRRWRRPRGRGAGRPGRRVGARARRCRPSRRRSGSVRSGDPPGDPEPGQMWRLVVLLARQNRHIEELGEALDEAIAALAEMRAELDDERRRR